MTFRQYLVLAGVTVFAASGDSLLSVGMKQVGQISFHRLPEMILAFLNPYVGFGILLLLAFFACYMAALSWADLTTCSLPTSLGYVLVALIAKFGLARTGQHLALDRHPASVGWCRVHRSRSFPPPQQSAKPARSCGVTRRAGLIPGVAP